MLWFLLGLMSVLAIGFVVWPLSKDMARQKTIVAIAVVFVAAGAASLYSQTGSPSLPEGAGQQADVAQMVSSLAERLEAQPDDLAGWKMLGRSYGTLGNFEGAVGAYTKAVALENAQNPDTLMRLGIAMAQADGETLTPRAVSVIENALAIDPSHPEALFYGGMTAFNRGDLAKAADRWEKLLETNPPPEIQGLLAQRIAEWRGEPPPAAAPAIAEQDGPVVTAAISLGDAARSALPEQATLFVIARDPKQPSPPIAVTRRTLSELPLSVALGDRESMIPGRNLSGFEQFEILARISVSGSPAAQPGDWFASAIVTPAEQSTIELTINERVQ